MLKAFLGTLMGVKIEGTHSLLCVILFFLIKALSFLYTSKSVLLVMLGLVFRKRNFLRFVLKVERKQKSNMQK